MKELKMSMITLNDYRELAEDNRRRMLSYERMYPTLLISILNLFNKNTMIWLIGYI